MTAAQSLLVSHVLNTFEEYWPGILYKALSMDLADVFLMMTLGLLVFEEEYHRGEEPLFSHPMLSGFLH